MEELAQEFHGAGAMALHGLTSLPFWLALAGVVTAYVFYMLKPEIPAAIQQRFGFIYRLLENKYYMDWINEHLLAPAARATGQGLWKGGDVALIDGAIYLYWYALVMIVGVVGLMTWQLWPYLGNPFGAR